MPGCPGRLLLGPHSSVDENEDETEKLPLWRLWKKNSESSFIHHKVSVSFMQLLTKCLLYAAIEGSTENKQEAGEPCPHAMIIHRSEGKRACSHKCIIISGMTRSMQTPKWLVPVTQQRQEDCCKSQDGSGLYSELWDGLGYRVRPSPLSKEDRPKAEKSWERPAKDG